MATNTKDAKPQKEKAKKNSLGMPTQRGWVIVRVGEEGEHTHILNPVTKAHYCRSGIKQGKVPKIYQSNAKHVTCQRCIKLSHLGLDPSKAGKRLAR